MVELAMNKSSVAEEIAAIGSIVKAIHPLDNSSAERALVYATQWLEDRMKEESKP